MDGYKSTQGRKMQSNFLKIISSQIKFYCKFFQNSPKKFSIYIPFREKIHSLSFFQVEKRAAKNAILMALSASFVRSFFGRLFRLKRTCNFRVSLAEGEIYDLVSNGGEWHKVTTYALPAVLHSF